MKKIKVPSLLADWLMRLAVLLFSWFYYGQVLKVMNLSSVMFYFSVVFVLFSALLVLGGFFRRRLLTLVPALVLTLLTGYQTVIFVQAGLDYNFAVFLLLGAVLVRLLSDEG